MRSSDHPRAWMAGSISLERVSDSFSSAPAAKRAPASGIMRRGSERSEWVQTLEIKGKRPVLAVCTSQEVSETIALKTRIVLRGDGGRFFDPESRRREAAAAKHREEAQDCGADDAAWCIGGAGGATAWGQRQPGVLLAQPLSPRPSGREERGQHQPAAGDGN